MLITEAFSDLVPDEPYGSGTDLGDGEGNPAYYLPVGSEGSVITRHSGQRLWDVMQQIAASIGYLLTFDALGMLQFRKFRTPPGIKRVFYESDPESGGLEGCWDVSVSKDMSGVRTEATVVGFDLYAPRMNPYVSKYADDAALNDPLAWNHVGYRSPAVWMDSMFADPTFAAQAAVEMARFLTIPGLDATFTTWTQPDVFPLDTVMLSSRVAGVDGLPLLVTGVRHHWSKEPGSTRITGRYVPA